MRRASVGTGSRLLCCSPCCSTSYKGGSKSRQNRRKRESWGAIVPETLSKTAHIQFPRKSLGEREKLLKTLVVPCEVRECKDAESKSS